MARNQQWKEAERKLASLFGTKRRPLSGMTHNTHGDGGDDCMHDKLFLESKYTGDSRSPYNALFKLYEDTRTKANKEKRIPVLGIRKKSAKGVILAFNSEDLPAILEEYAKANGLSLSFTEVGISMVPCVCGSCGNCIPLDYSETGDGLPSKEEPTPKVSKHPIPKKKIKSSDTVPVKPRIKRA